MSIQIKEIYLKHIYLSVDSSDFYLYWQVPFRLMHSSHMPIALSTCIYDRGCLIVLIIPTTSLRTKLMS